MVKFPDLDPPPSIKFTILVMDDLSTFDIIPIIDKRQTPTKKLQKNFMPISLYKSEEH